MLCPYLSKNKIIGGGQTKRSVSVNCFWVDHFLSISFGFLLPMRTEFIIRFVFCKFYLYVWLSVPLGKVPVAVKSDQK